MANNSSSRKRKWIVLTVVLVAVISGAIWFFAEKQGAAVQYRTVPVTRGELVQLVTAAGQLNPVVNVQVGSQISGRIKDLFVDFNSLVKSNQIIAQIDPSTYQVAVLRAEAQLSNTVANLALANIQAGRADALFATRLISAADHDTAIAQRDQAEADVRSSRANLESAQVDLSRCTIYAPVDGVVISRNVDVGQTVAASFNTPTLFVIANDLTKMQIHALVSEADIGGVAVGQNVNFTVDAYPYRTFRGQVSQIRYGPVTNQNVISYDGVIDVDNADLKLLPGMTANVSIIVAERENALKVPNAVLRFRPPEVASLTTKTNGAARNPTGEGRRNPEAGGQGRGGFRGGGGGGGGGPGGSGGPRAPGSGFGGTRPDHFNQRTVYLLGNGKETAGSVLTPVQIRTGINDGLSTEVLEGLKEGDQVVAGVLASDSDPAAARPVNPFGGPRRF
jgi:HlyD family secretion protein